MAKNILYQYFKPYNRPPEKSMCCFFNIFMFNDNIV